MGSRRLMNAKLIRRSIGRWVSIKASTAPRARICSRRLAWTNSMSAKLRLLTSPQTELALPTGQLMSRKTRSGSPHVLGRPRQHAPVQEGEGLGRVPRCDDGCFRADVVLSPLFSPGRTIRAFPSDLGFGSCRGLIAIL